MSRDYTVGVLRAGDVYRAYALVQHLFPKADLSMWTHMTASEEQRRNWLAVVDAGGVIRGLCYVFTRELSPLLWQLEVPVFASVSLVDEDGVARQLFEVARQRAGEMHCASVHFWPAGDKEWAIVTDPGRASASGDGVVYQLDETEGPVLHQGASPGGAAPMAGGARRPCR